MFVSGFTIIKNAIINDYPILEAINSILPVVDEMIVLVGDSEDATLELIENINSDKIKIHHSVWDNTLRKGGEVLAVETNKAFKLINPKADWAFYIQADEAVHEKYLPAIKKAMEQHVDNKKVEGLLFNYTHFFGTYDYIGNSRKWYQKEVRIVRNDQSIYSYKDAQGFRKDDRKLNVKQIDAFVYHYGWVKSPSQMVNKQKNIIQYWYDDNGVQKIIERLPEDFDYDSFDSIDKFNGTHPAVMQKRLAEKHWHLDLDLSKKSFSFKNKILFYFEKFTGIRLFEYKNYKIIS